MFSTSYFKISYFTTIQIKLMLVSGTITKPWLKRSFGMDMISPKHSSPKQPSLFKVVKKFVDVVVCVFQPAFGCCVHPKAGLTTFFSCFQPFLSKSWLNCRSNMVNCWCFDLPTKHWMKIIIFGVILWTKTTWQIFFYFKVKDIDTSTVRF